MNSRNLSIIVKKIEKLQTAIFMDLSNGLLKFPTSVIRILRIDCFGNIWFKIYKPYVEMNQFQDYSFAQLFFYNKRFGFFVRVQGYADIVFNEGELIGENESMNDPYVQKKCLIHFKILYFEYFILKKKSRNYKDELRRYLIHFFKSLRSLFAKEFKLSGYKYFF